MVICGPYPDGPETGLKPGPPVCSFLRCLAHKAPRGHHFIWVAWEALHDAVQWVILSLCFFQKWESVKLLYVKTEKSASLPIFSSFVSIQDDAELQALRQKKNVSWGARAQWEGCLRSLRLDLQHPRRSHKPARHDS